MNRALRELCEGFCAGALAVAIAGGVERAMAGPTDNGCAPPAELLTWLETEHGERVVGLGRLGNGAAVLLTMSPEGSWTLLAAMPDGTACMAAAGVRATPPEEQGAPS